MKSLFVLSALLCLLSCKPKVEVPLVSPSNEVPQMEEVIITKLTKDEIVALISAGKADSLVSIQELKYCGTKTNKCSGSCPSGTTCGASPVNDDNCWCYPN